MQSNKPEIYISVDVESDGPCPGVNSMLSLGAVAFDKDGRELDEFYTNIETLPDAVQDKETMQFWKDNQEAYDATRVDMVDARGAAINFAYWIARMRAHGEPVFLAWPAGYDFTFVQWYLLKFAGSTPFGFKALDVQSYIMGRFGCDFRDATYRKLKREWLAEGMNNDHNALNDAREQGRVFINMLKDKTNA